MTPVRDRWLLVYAAGAVVFVAMLETSIVNVALPAIRDDLGSDPALTQWTVLAYLLPVVALVLPAGRWLDRVGKRVALVVSVGGFAVASAAAGLAPGIGFLVAARVAQGVCAAVMFALMPVLATLAVRPEARGRAMSVLATLGPLGAVTGPPLGGLLLGVAGWRPVFFAVVPVAVAIVLVGVFAMPDDGPLAVPDRHWLAEAALLAVGAGVLLVALTRTAEAGPEWLLLLLPAAVVMGLWWRMPASRPVTTLLNVSGVFAGHVAVLLLALGFAVMQFLLPFYLGDVVDVGPEATGLTMLAFAVGMGVAGPVGGVLADRWGAWRAGAVGAVVVTVGLLLVQPLSPGWEPLDVVWRLALAGIGMGLYGGPVQAMVMTAAPRALIATTGGTIQLARNLGFALGPAVATTVWAVDRYSDTGMRTALAVGVLAAGCGALTLGAHWWRRARNRSATVDPGRQPVPERSSSR
ncbi:Predicted arabinose efflux permease, MFS family [Micromonospora pallida]|uniref:Predicted arabinose efflux permease, MFS family n=1 Tax=Micromonospora pallida TaxID=145854 RepID=A0A1C6RIW2_9ACTN|nr:MFS transporter [Micromonospora pallida]SCL17104.1 Predicted arabinose efflux permease, MFS family [Micromonospora pallida]